MRLAELLADSGLRSPYNALRVQGDPQVEITGLSYDSRRTKAGDLFFSLARDNAHGRRNVAEALNRGARGVVVRKWDEEEARPAATLIESEQPRLLMGAAASRYFGAPSQRMDLVGVTGTSGKTTTTYLLASIFEAAGAPAGIIGTIGIFVAGRKTYTGLTTPESIDFECALAQMKSAGIPRVAAEVSSIGLAEHRVDALSFRACVFTNLGRDHLDYHGSIENYYAAKVRLFTEILPNSRRADPVAVIRGDDPYGARVLADTPCRKLSFGLDGSLDVHPVDFHADLGGIRASIQALDRRIEIDSPLVGKINLLNILAASAVSVALGIETEAVVDGVRRCPGAPGRLEAVRARTGVTVLVDYAHKPDALAGVLETLRALNPHRIICVFGCGGDRDRGKRPIMGEIAARMSDLPILTSDNPRSEDPLAIIAEVEAGLRQPGLSRIGVGADADRRGYLVEPDRRRAIALALDSAGPGDVVIIAGKGHEDYQLVGDRKLDFDDRVAVREIAAEHGWN